MRIAYLTNQYPATSHTFIRREIAALEDRGHSVLRFAIRHSSECLIDPVDIEELGRTRSVLDRNLAPLFLMAMKTALTRPIRALRALFSTARFYAASRRGLLRHLAYFLEALALAAWCMQDGAQHLQVHFGTNSAAVGALVGELTGIPFSFTVHGPEEFDRATVDSLGLKMAMASFVLAVSSFGRSQLMRWAALEDWNKIHVVHCGLEKTYLDDPSCPAPKEPSLLCVGRLSEQKGHFMLLEAAAMLRDRGVDFNITLVGDGPMRGLIEQAIHNFDLADHVQLVGWMSQPQIRQEILNSRAMVLPSVAEGLPVVLMESMALRRPVISTYVAGIPELVCSDCGWLVPAGDPVALCDAMQAVVEASEATLQQMGEQAWKRVAARHDVAVSAGLIEQHILAVRKEAAYSAGASGRCPMSISPGTRTTPAA